MTTIINAVSGTGLTQSADGSGIVKLQSNGSTTNALAWVNWNGSTNTIKASYNVGSITKNSTGDYTLNFTTAMSDANYSVAGMSTGFNALTNHDMSLAIQGTYSGGPTLKTATQLRVNIASATISSGYDATEICVSIFGN